MSAGRAPAYRGFFEPVTVVALWSAYGPVAEACRAATAARSGDVRARNAQLVHNHHISVQNE
jgi:hypothetical protein